MILLLMPFGLPKILCGQKDSLKCVEIHNDCIGSSVSGSRRRLDLEQLKLCWETKYMPNCAGVMQLIITYGKTRHLRVVVGNMERFHLDATPQKGWQRIWDDAVRGDFTAIDPQIKVCHYNALRRIAMDNMKGEGIEKEVNVFWGPTGVGKRKEELGMKLA